MSAERFMVVHFPDAVPEGSELSVWPLHTTVVPWSHGDLTGFTQTVQTELEGCAPYEAWVSERVYFGPHQDIPVYLLEPRSEMRRLHDIVLEAVERHGEVVADQAFLGDNYIPHITPKPHQPAVTVGQRLPIQKLSVVQKLEAKRLVYKQLQVGHV